MPANTRAASYDLTVGSVVIDGTEYKTDIPKVKPQQIVVLVSKETVMVPPGHVAYAMPKTSLCMEGIHTLNTGIVDPGWCGKLSSVAINFERSD